jgi:Domain of unknown function (DUF4349)
MTTHPIEPEELMAYLDGELLLDRAAAAAEHLTHCRDCQRLAADLQSVSRKLMTWEVAAPEDLKAPVVEGMTAVPSREPGLFAKLHWLWGRRGARWAMAVAAAVLILGIAPIAYWQTRPGARPIGERESDYVQLQRAGGQQGAAAGKNITIDGNGANDSFLVNGSVSQEAAQRIAPQRKALRQFTPPWPPVPNPVPAGSMIARTANLAITATDFDQVRPAIEDILKRHGGYAANLDINSQTGGSRKLNAALRLPSDHFDSAIAEVKKVGHVEAESRDASDVTSQYVDLEARLDNARHTEQRLTELLRDRTGKLSDVLSVEVEIGRVRGEIERMEAEKKSMLNQVSFSTLNLTVAENYQAQLQIVPDSTLTRFRNAAVSGYKTMAGSLLDVALFLVAYLPTLLLWGVLIVAAYVGWRRVRRSRQSA